MRIVLKSPARRELIEATAFYSERSGVELAQSFIDAFEQALTLLRHHPRLGSVMLEHYRR